MWWEWILERVGEKDWVRVGLQRREFLQQCGERGRAAPLHKPTFPAWSMQDLARSAKWNADNEPG